MNWKIRGLQQFSNSQLPLPDPLPNLPLRFLTANIINNKKQILIAKSWFTYSFEILDWIPFFRFFGLILPLGIDSGSVSILVLYTQSNHRPINRLERGEHVEALGRLKRSDNRFEDVIDDFKASGSFTLPERTLCAFTNRSGFDLCEGPRQSSHRSIVRDSRIM